MTERQSKDELQVMSDDDAALIIESVLDTLVEVGNGVTDEHLHAAADKLFKFRDEWFDPRYERKQKEKANDRKAK